MDTHPLLIILGPTASGKTKLAVNMADVLGGEIISADSRQVYRDMDIGTGKDLLEYHLNGHDIPYHLINIREAGGTYNVNAFKEDFYEVLGQLKIKQKLPILCGGTGMYIHSLLQNHQYTAIPVNETLRAELPLHDIQALRDHLAVYPLSMTAQADLSSAKRLIRAIEIADYLQHHSFTEAVFPELDPLIIGLAGSVESRRERILKRLEERFEEGLIDEVAGLIRSGVDPEVLRFYGLEYKFVTDYLQNRLNFEDLKEQLYIAIRQFAKRQMTFFRKMEKDGVKITWLDTDLGACSLKAAALESYHEKFGH
ncbi:tRNA (adenosine(37)-N6)-dimethylallyltransferase MiaA [Pedobacter sp. L105]|uniref:tRNA (adenosine(37)-N6)-dimethylallyltransferase MiaA n=1 Tax=Pedobacter sp. L105 TaxID=1641871 RepID=UPI00131E1A5B|nr:tRNA (adenosine(37)-N6)-dimethylallyltransferase MiaA [Pedobacter sp. L105]